MATTLAEMIAIGEWYTAWCYACQHHSEMDMKALAEKVGPDHGCSGTDLIPLMRCSVCGSKNVGVRRRMNLKMGCRW